MTRLFPPKAECIVNIHAQLEHLRKIKSISTGQAFTAEQLSTIIETAFWAGLKPNEGRTTRVSLSVAAPEYLPGAATFRSPIPCDEATIVKLAPAVPLQHSLGVSVVNDALQIWGFAPNGIKALDSLAVKLTEPGTVRVDVGPYRPYAVLDGRSNNILAATGSDLAHYLRQKLGKAFPEGDILETQAIWQECLALADHVRMILSDGHGGTVLVVPSETGDWESSLDPFLFRLKAPITVIRDIIRKNLDNANDQGQLLDELSQASISDDVKNRIIAALHPINIDYQRSVRAIASFAKVDGAVVMTHDIQVLGFGAKIVFPSSQEVKICKFEPMSGSQSVLHLPLEDIGGMRHQSAARFVEANRDSVAIVVSQDRHVSLMNWENELCSVCVVRNAEWWA